MCTNKQTTDLHNLHNNGLSMLYMSAILSVQLGGDQPHTLYMHVCTYYIVVLPCNTHTPYNDSCTCVTMYSSSVNPFCPSSSPSPPLPSPFFTCSSARSSLFCSSQRSAMLMATWFYTEGRQNKARRMWGLPGWFQWTVPRVHKI